MKWPALIALCAFVSACGGNGSESSEQTALIAVNAPFSRTPYVGQTIADGAQLAADESTIETDDGKVRFRGVVNPVLMERLLLAEARGS